MIDPARRDAVRSRVVARREAATDLHDRLTDAYLKAQVALACNWLKDVERLFLGEANESRTVEAQAMWLDGAEQMLGIADAVLRQVEAVVAKYGPDAVSV